MTREDAKKSMVAQAERALDEQADWLRMADLAQGVDFQLEASCVRLSARAKARATGMIKSVYVPGDVDEHMRQHTA